MSFYRNGLLVMGIVVFLLGAAVNFGLHPQQTPPPRTEPTEAPQSNRVIPSFPAVSTLIGPWAVPAAPAARVNPPKPSPPPPVVDRKSVAYVGSYQDQSGKTAYFFKVKAINQVIVLHDQAQMKGWTLVQVSPRSFTLKGPGGLYEITRP